MTKFSNKSKKILFYVLGGIIFSGCIAVASILSNFIINADTLSTSIEIPSFELNFISLAKSKLEKEVIAQKPYLQELGAGAVVWKNEEYYHLFSSGFAQKNDAQLVQNSISQNLNLQSEIITITFPTFSLSGNFNSDEKRAIFSALALAQTYYNDLYDISISLDTNITSLTSAKLAINGAINNLSVCYSNFDTIYKYPKDKTISELKNLLISYIETAQDLTLEKKESDSQTYPSLIKNNYLKILKLYYNFVN